MDSATTVSNGLAAWGRKIDQAMIDAVIAHPAFADSVQTLARTQLDLQVTDKGLEGVNKDGGRYGVAMLAIHLHLSGGLTLPRLKAMSVLSSPGRARALLLYLRYLGFIIRGPKTGNGPDVFVPTPRFLEAWLKHIGVALEAACLVEPAARAVFDAYEGEIATAFTRWHCHNLLDAIAEPDKVHPSLHKLFLHKHAGMQILLALIASEADGRFPPQRTRPVTLTELSRRFAVSRTHVRRLFDAAARDNFLTHEDGGAVIFHPDTAARLSYFYAMQMCWLLAAAGRTVAQYPHLG